MKRRSVYLQVFRCLLVAAYLLSVGYAAAQQQPDPPTEESSSQTSSQAPAGTEKEQEKEKQQKRGALVVAPIPVSSPAIGSGLVLVVGYIFPFSRRDKVSPPSVIGAAGLYTNNQSKAFAVGGELFLKENTYHVTAGFVRGNLNYDLYGTGTAAGNAGRKLPLNQTGQAFLGEFQRRIGWGFFAGPQFVTGHSLITVRDAGNSSVPLPPDLGLHTTLTGLGFEISRDTRPNQFYPVSGSRFNFSSIFFGKSLGSKYSFQTYRTKFDYYFGLSERQVLAYDLYLCGTGGSPPFYGECLYGTQNELRGYVAGRYIDRYMAATQLEYRLTLPKRFGIVLFGGIGEVAPSIGKFNNDDVLPAGGLGLRFMLSKKYHVNLRADIAQGKDGHTFSMGLGEAF